MTGMNDNRRNVRVRRDSILVAETKLASIIAENLDRLRKIWDKVGMNEEQRHARIFTVITHAESLFGDMVNEESEMAEKLAETVEEYQEELSYLAKELHCHKPDIKEVESLVDAERDLKLVVEQMREEKSRRMKAYKILYDEDVEICSSMCIATYSISPNLVPTERQLNELKIHIEQNRRERDYRRAKVAEYKAKITRFMVKLNLKPKNDVEKRIVNDPLDALSLTTDFLLNLEAVQDDLQSRYDFYLESVRRQVGPLKEKLLILWRLCRVDQACRDNFQQVNEEDFDEEALDRYNAELARWENYYRERREVLDKIDCWMRLWNQKLAYEAKDLDANRLNNRGGALLAEEKERNKLEKRLPVIQKEIKLALDRWNAGHHRQEVLFDGHPVLAHLDRIQKDYHETKEKEKLEKQMAKKNQLEAERLYGTSPSVSKKTTVVRRACTPDSRNKENGACAGTSKVSVHSNLALTRSPSHLQSTATGAIARPLASKPPHLPRPPAKNKRRADQRVVPLAQLNRVDESLSNASTDSYDACVHNFRKKTVQNSFVVGSSPSPTKMYKK